MTPESRAFLKYLSDQPKGRVGYPATKWPEATALAMESVLKGYVRHRPKHPHKNGFQITDAGKAYLAGEASE